MFMGRVAGRQMKAVNNDHDKTVWGKIVARHTASPKPPAKTYSWQEKRSTARRVVFDSDGESRQKKRSKAEPFPKTDLEANIFRLDIWGKYRLRRMIWFGMKSVARSGSFFIISGVDRRHVKSYFKDFEEYHHSGMHTAEQRDDAETKLVAPNVDDYFFSEITKNHHLKQTEQEETWATGNWKVIGDCIDGANLGVNNPKNPKGVKGFKNIKMQFSGFMTAVVRIEVRLWNRGQHRIPTLKVTLFTVTMSGESLIMSAGMADHPPYAPGWQKSFAKSALDMDRAHQINVPAAVVEKLKLLQSGATAATTAPPSPGEESPEDMTVEIQGCMHRAQEDSAVVQTQSGSRVIVDKANFLASSNGSVSAASVGCKSEVRAFSLRSVSSVSSFDEFARFDKSATYNEGSVATAARSMGSSLDGLRHLTGETTPQPHRRVAEPRIVMCPDELDSELELASNVSGSGPENADDNTTIDLVRLPAVVAASRGPIDHVAEAGVAETNNANELVDDPAASAQAANMQPAHTQAQLAHLDTFDFTGVNGEEDDEVEHEVGALTEENLSLHDSAIALHDATHATAGEGAILATPARPANTHSVGTGGLAAPANSDATQPYIP